MVTHSFPWSTTTTSRAVRARSGISSDAEVASAAAEPRRSRRRGAAAARAAAGRRQGGQDEGGGGGGRAAVARWQGGGGGVCSRTARLPLPTSARSQDSRVLRPTPPHVVMVPAPQRSARWRALPCTGRGRELARALT